MVDIRQTLALADTGGGGGDDATPMSLSEMAPERHLADRSEILHSD